MPPVQARKIYQALKEKGLPVALVEYEGEQHGFRKVCIIYVLSNHIIFIFEVNIRINQIVLHRLKILNSHWSNKWYSLLV